MDHRTVLSEAELKALLDAESAEYEPASPLEPEGGGDPEGNAPAPAGRNEDRLYRAVSALAARVELLERQVKDLRMQALADERETKVPSRPAKQDNAARETVSSAEAERESSRLSRVERYGKAGSRRLL